MFLSFIFPFLYIFYFISIIWRSTYVSTTLWTLTIMDMDIYYFQGLFFLSFKALQAMGSLNNQIGLVCLLEFLTCSLSEPLVLMPLN